MLSILKLLLPLPLAAAIPPQQPYQPPHRVMPISTGVYKAEQWGHADMQLSANPGDTTYRAHFNTDDGPHDYTLTFYAMSCLPAGVWLTVKQPLVAGTTQPDASRQVSYNASSGRVPGNFYVYAISRAEEDQGLFAPQLESSLAEVDKTVADFCDLTIKPTTGESPIVYSYQAQ